MPGSAKAPVFLISGTPGSGKTSVAQALLRHFPLGLHLPLDDFREFVVSGRASVFNWSEETDRQFALARTAAVGMATSYLEAGFAVALDDVPRLLKDKEVGKVVSSDFTTDVSTDRTKRITLTKDEILGAGQRGEHRLNHLSGGIHERSPDARIERIGFRWRINTRTDISFITQAQSSFRVR